MENTAVIEVDDEFVGNVIGEALENALLCPRCTQLVEERSAAGKPTERKKICPICQSVIMRLLEGEVEGRLREALRAQGLPERILIGHSN
jgi:hypothetical protein